jgi:hypothetical protein
MHTQEQEDSFVSILFIINEFCGIGLLIVFIDVCMYLESFIDVFVKLV